MPYNDYFESNRRPPFNPGSILLGLLLGVALLAFYRWWSGPVQQPNPLNVGLLDGTVVEVTPTAGPADTVTRNERRRGLPSNSS